MWCPWKCRDGDRRSVIEHEMKSNQMRCVSRDKHKDRETELVRVEVSLNTRLGARMIFDLSSRTSRGTPRCDTSQKLR